NFLSAQIRVYLRLTVSSNGGSRRSMKLANRIAFITGGGRGIGRAIALEFAREGASVTLAARTRAEIDKVAGEVRAAGGTAAAVQCDVAKFGDVERAFEFSKKEFGRAPDILV